MISGNSGNSLISSLFSAWFLFGPQTKGAGGPLTIPSSVLGAELGYPTELGLELGPLPPKHTELSL